MESSEAKKLRQELREKARAEKWYEVEDGKRFLKKAILTRGGEKLQEEVQLAEQQQDQKQQTEDEERAFSEMLERNSEDWESERR